MPTPSSARGSEELHDFPRWLARADCTMHVRLSQYDHARYNLLTNQTSLAVNAASLNCTLLESSWSVTTRCTAVSAETDALDVAVVFKCHEGMLPSASVSVDLEFRNWTEANYVLLPAVAYNGNRFGSRRLRYSPKLYEVQDIGPDKPIIISDVPRLGQSGEVSRLQERAGSMATPSIGFYAPQTGTGFWLLCEPSNSLGDFGISIEETRGRDRAIISLTSPVVRELYNYRICDARFPSLDQPRDFQSGDTVTIVFRLHSFPAPNLQGLFDRFVEIRKGLNTSRARPATLCPIRRALMCRRRNSTRSISCPRMATTRSVSVRISSKIGKSAGPAG